jgi:hypothetical protein
MKKFKIKEKLFMCEECNSFHKNKGELSKHINRCHNGIKIYYDKWLKEKDDNLCKICGKETNFKNSLDGYKNICSRECSIKYTSQKVQKSMFEKYGSISAFGNKNIIKKSKETMLLRYGKEHFTNSEKTKQTCLEKYGVENPYQIKETKEKIRQTNLKNRGVTSPMQSKEVREKSKQTCLEKYGVECSLQNKEINEKRKKTMIERYGVEYSAQNKWIREKQINTNKNKYGENFFKIFLEKSKKTRKDKYGNENYNNREKYKKTCLKKYGVEYSLQSSKIKEKGKNTCLKKYGVEHPSQYKEIHDKIQRSCFRIKKFRDTNIWYQGSYELDFLEKYYDKFQDIQRGPSIKYTYKGKNKVYHPDFYIPSLNLIVECKNSYLAKRDKYLIEEKKKSTISNGFNYIIIVNKNYNDFIYPCSHSVSKELIK